MYRSFAAAAVVLAVSSFAGDFDPSMTEAFSTRSRLLSDLYGAEKVIYQGETEFLEYPLGDFQVAMLDGEELMLLRNTIFAIHGYSFSDPSLLEHFQEFAWYSPESEDVAHLLTDIDLYNLDLITVYEDAGTAESEESPGSEDMAGFWHGSPHVAAGYSKTYLLYPDGRFAYRTNQMDGSRRLLEFSGSWSLEGGFLVLRADSMEYLEGGTLVAPYASYGSDYVIENGEVELRELDPPVAMRLPITGFSLYSDAGGMEDVPVPQVMIGSGKFWRIFSGETMPD